MYQKKLEKDIRCPLEYGLSVFGGKWKSRIHYVVTEEWFVWSKQTFL